MKICGETDGVTKVRRGVERSARASARGVGNKTQRVENRGVRTSRHAVVLKLRSIAPAMVPVAMYGDVGANATVAHRFTCFT